MGERGNAAAHSCSDVVVFQLSRRKVTVGSATTNSRLISQSIQFRQIISEIDMMRTPQTVPGVPPISTGIRLTREVSAKPGGTASNIMVGVAKER